MLRDFSTESIINYLIMLPALFLSLSIHEFAHAFIAYKLGDKSQKYQGRLTFSPFAHIDWLGFISISLIGIGWGKPVQVDTTNFKKPKKGLMLTALAGPMSNLILAFIVTIILKVLDIFGVVAIMQSTQIGIYIFTMILTTIAFNVTFAVFNMIPIPPFDGSKVLFYFLPYKWRNVEFFLAKYSFIIILLLFVTNFGSLIIAPFESVIYTVLNFILML